MFLYLSAASPASPLTDKILHGLAGASCSLLTCAAVSALILPEPENEAAFQRTLTIAASGLGSSILAGVVKELADLGGFGRAEWLDLAAVVAGGLAASSFVLAVSCLASSRGSAGLRLQPVFASFGVVFAIPPGEALFKRLFGRRTGASSED